MSDYLVRILAKENGVRGLACVTTALVQEAADRHQTAPTATVALSRAMTGAALAGALLKVKQRVGLKFEGNGPLGKVLAESDAYGRIRGYVSVPNVTLTTTNDENDVVAAIGRAGLLTVVKDVKLKNLVESVIPLAVSDFEGDLNDYFEQSEQIPTTVQLAEALDETGRLKFAGGLLIQDVPTKGDDETIVALQDRLQELPHLTDLMSAGKSPEDVLDLIFEGISYELLEKRELRFACDCSWDRTRQGLLTLGAAEIENLLELDGEIVVNCHYCGETYTYNEFELEVMLAELGA